MNNLKAIVPVIDNSNNQVTMSSLEIVEFINKWREAEAHNVGVEFPSKEYHKLRHDHFMSKVPEVLGTEGLPNFRETYISKQNGQEYPCYKFPKREACLMLMSYSYEMQAAVYDRMTELEMMQKAGLPDFTNPVVAARAWADKAEALQISEAENTELKQQALLDRPKVIFAEAVSTSTTTILIRDLAKLLNQNGIVTGEKRLFQWLRENGYLTKRNTPTQKAMEMGLFEMQERAIHMPDSEPQLKFTTKVTPKGQQYFINRFINQQPQKTLLLQSNSKTV